MSKGEKVRTYCCENYDTTGGSAKYYFTFGNESQRNNQRNEFRKLQKSRNQLSIYLIKDWKPRKIKMIPYS